MNLRRSFATLSLVTTIVATLTGCASVRSPPTEASDATGVTDACDRPWKEMHFIGAPKTIAEVEKESLLEMKKAPHAPQVPFGYENRKWEDLKSNMQPGDELYEYNAGFQGGHVMIRSGCIVGLLLGWIT